MYPTNAVSQKIATYKVVSKVVQLVNAINPYIFITALFTIFYVRFELNPNEEHYLALAKQYMNPQWLPHSFSLVEAPSTRILFQYLVGFFLQFFSIPIVAFWGKLGLALAFAYPLASLYQLFKFNNVDLLSHLAILYFPCQSFFADEFMFLSLEPKGFAYIFVLFALYNAFKEKYWLVAIFSAAATYFHLLVGGWFMAYFCLYHLIKERSIKQTLLIGISYVAILLPLFLFLFSAIAENISISAAVVSVDWIYTYFKQPHHTAVFLSLSYFIKQHSDGVLLTIVFFIFSLFIYHNLTDELSKKLNLFSIVIFAGTMLCLVIAFFDREGRFLKFFLFRINSLYVFLVFLQIIYTLKRYVIKPRYLSYWYFGIIIWFTFSIGIRLFYGTVMDIYNFTQYRIEDAAFQEITDHIKNNTDRKAVFLLLSQQSQAEDYEYVDLTDYGTFDMNNSFIQRTDRDVFVSLFFGPISPGSAKVYQWYERLQAKLQIIKNNSAICNINATYRVDYVLSDYPLEVFGCNETVYQNDKYFLYQLNKNVIAH